MDDLLAAHALQASIEQRQQDLARLELQAQQVEAALAEKERFARELRVRAGTRVKLDVGGVHFTTSTTTLLSQPESMLAAMFSGRHELEKDEDGRVFIDQDGELFKYVLQYLRDGDLDVSRLDQGLRDRLKREAAYYCLTNLEKKLATGRTPNGELPGSIYLRVRLMNSISPFIESCPRAIALEGDPFGITPILRQPEWEEKRTNWSSFVVKDWDKWVWEEFIPTLLRCYSSYHLVSVTGLLSGFQGESYCTFHFNRIR